MSNSNINNNGNNNFDNLLERQVEEFNQRMEASSNFHKYVLHALCDEHIRREFETTYDPLETKRQRTTQARSSITAARKSLLRQVSRVGKRGRTVLRGLSPTSKQQAVCPQKLPTDDREDPPIIIEGEFRVISDNPYVDETTNPFNPNVKEKQP